MTPHDNVQDRVDRLAQRQDQLERQQRETETRVDALKRDVDSRIDSLRREIDWQFRDREWRIKSLERSRDTVESFISLWMPLVAAIAMVIVLVIAVIESREERQGAGEPERRSPSYMNAPPASSGGRVQSGFAAAGTPFRQHYRYPDNHGQRPRELTTFNTPLVENGHRSSINPVGSTVSTQQFATCSATAPGGPAGQAVTYSRALKSRAVAVNNGPQLDGA